MQDQEIERKFKVLALPPDFFAATPVLVEQAYLNLDKDRATRVRVATEPASPEAGFLTVKGRSRGATRKEIETGIEARAARAMFEMREGEMVEKIRRKVEHAGKTWEVDVFLNGNAGLVTAEIELGSEDEAFERPQWLGEEITEDHRFSNSTLAQRPFGAWADKADHAFAFASEEQREAAMSTGAAAVTGAKPASPR